MPGRGPASLQMTQEEWRVWAQNRENDAPKIEKLYRKQAKDVREVLADRGCRCNPLIVMTQGQHGGPTTSNVSITHAMDCTEK